MKKIIWLILSSMMVAALLLASCTPTVTEEEEVTPPPEKEEKVVTEEEVAPPPEGPQYGGVLNYAVTSSNYGFDEGYLPPPFVWPLGLSHDTLLIQDWAKGPAGTGEITGRSSVAKTSTLTGCVAESWELPADDTIIYHIRKGIYFPNKPPVNGRQVTAEDVAWSIQRYYFGGLTYNFNIRAPAVINISSVEATDKWTVVVKCDPYGLPARFFNLVSMPRINAPEAGKGEYPKDFRDAETCIGSGPFILEDEVEASCLTYVRNPNYWRNDPLHPENTLPYVDKVNILIIPDASTRMAALRAGKIDTLGNLNWEDKESLVKTNPELMWVDFLSPQGGEIIGMRVDAPPLDDQRVRRALSMGFDREVIAKDYFNGNAEVFAFPVLPSPDYADMFIPLDELSEAIQEQYEHNPEKAKQLLAEAGYPDGFKTEVACNAAQVDLLSILEAYWADIGVELNIDVKEMGVWRGLGGTHKFNQMYMAGAASGRPEIMLQFVETHANYCCCRDKFLTDLGMYTVDSLFLKRDELCKVYSEQVTPYVLEKCWYLDFPAPVLSNFWQLWLKGYQGEVMTWQPYVWIDQELKREMGR